MYDILLGPQKCDPHFFFLSSGVHEHMLLFFVNKFLYAALANHLFLVRE
jgi:hypothetical protein